MVLAVGLRSQLSHFFTRGTADNALRLSFCRFHDASTSEILRQNIDGKKPSDFMIKFYQNISALEGRPQRWSSRCSP